MSAESQLYAALSGRAGLAALIADRIYPDAIPEKKPLPAIVYIRASTSPTFTIGGVLICEDVRFSVTAWAATREAANAVADQVAAALMQSGNPPVDRSSGFDGETGLYAANIDVDWFWSA